MKISERWLREHVEVTGDTATLAEQLTLQGLEVDAVLPAAPPLEKVVVGRVVEVSSHPDADRLRVCRVSTGGDPLQIVCGAPNVLVDRLYPVALVGARLPGDLVIRPAKLRGVASAGMLCSATELGLAEAADGLLELPADAPVGESVSTALGLDDQVLDINITPNRADCFSVIGLARDVAAAAGALYRDVATIAVPAATSATLPVVLEAGAGCSHFAGRVIQDLNPDAIAPLWLRERLRRSGIRSISPVVDVTNYVMLELGQPLHAYDLERLDGGLQARRAVAGERLSLLTGTEQALDGEVLVIADDSGPVGLAGIMGGDRTGVAPGTRHVFLESAWFEPGVIAGRARRFGLQTDASMRFERGVDPAIQTAALERATALLMEIAAGRPGPAVITGEQPAPRATVRLRRRRLTQVLGIDIADADVETILRRLGIAVSAAADGWDLAPPTFRFDLTLEADYIEEVARIHGYQAIPARAGRQATHLAPAPEDRVPRERAASTMVERGYHEAVTYSFTDPRLDRRLAGGRDSARLVNPISADLGVMRQSLWTGLLLALRHNLSRQQARVRLFEQGVSFIPQVADLEEKPVLAGIVYGSRHPEQWSAVDEPVDFYDVKADVEALLALAGAGANFVFRPDVHPALQPGRTARIERSGETAGWLGVLHPAIAAELELPAPAVLFELDVAVAFRRTAGDYRPVSRFPALRRDLAVVVAENVSAAALLDAVRQAAGPVLRELQLFDIYVGERVDAGQKSVALGLILQETSRTLTDADVDGVIGSVVARLAADFSARIRE